MPLGKLSRKQLERAYSTLNELNTIIESSDDKTKQGLVIVTTNKFYSLIPHDFGVKMPQLIDSKEILNVCTQVFYWLKVEFLYQYYTQPI